MSLSSEVVVWAFLQSALQKSLCAMRKFSEKYPEQRITYRWADEDIGYNVGEIVLKGGKVIEDHTTVPESREA